MDRLILLWSTSCRLQNLLALGISHPMVAKVHITLNIQHSKAPHQAMYPIVCYTSLPLLHTTSLNQHPTSKSRQSVIILCRHSGIFGDSKAIIGLVRTVDLGKAGNSQDLFWSCDCLDVILGLGLGSVWGTVRLSILRSMKAPAHPRGLRAI